MTESASASHDIATRELNNSVVQDGLQDGLKAWRWDGNVLHLLDQRVLPARTTWLPIHNAREAAQAIRDMVVRGAPAIGMTAAFALVMEARLRASHEAQRVAGTWRQLDDAMSELAASRPTAVNLFWALNRMKDCLSQATSPEDLLSVAESYVAEDLAANHAIGDAGAALLPLGSRVYTHCNTGSLATAGYGTALGVIRSAWRDQRLHQVYAGETRPWLQGARLTAYELQHENIPFELCADGAAASLFAADMVDWVIVGADRITAGGDVANKIGTYALAVLAHYHHKKFMVAAHTSTIDWDMLAGDQITIEQRPSEEVSSVFGHAIAPADTAAYNPAFDVTPAGLITAIVTERGVVMHPNADNMSQLRRS